jgi:gas vesicle protein
VATNPKTNTTAGTSSTTRDFLLGVIVGAVLSLGTAWYFAIGRHRADVRRAQDTTAATLHRAADAAEAKVAAWHLTTPEITAELARTGKVVRRSVTTFGEQAGHVANDAAITGRIKAKLVADRELSAWDININTTAGIVTLSGIVPAHGHIGRATMLALDTEGVREVHSTLQVRK